MESLDQRQLALISMIQQLRREYDSLKREVDMALLWSKLLHGRCHLLQLDIIFDSGHRI